MTIIWIRAIADAVTTLVDFLWPATTRLPIGADDDQAVDA